MNTSEAIATGLQGTPDQRTPRGAGSALALALLATVQLMVVLDMTIVNVTLPTIERSLGFSGASIAWVVNAYALPFGALLLLGGRSGDLLGRRRVFIASTVVFGFASLVAGLATTPEVLIGARVVQGMSAAFAQATALGLIVATFPSGPSRNRAVGVFAAMEGLGAAGGLLLGGVILEYMSWRWIFLVNIPVVLGVAALAPRYLARSSRRSGQFDLAGASLVTTGLAGLVFALTRAAEHGWSDAATLIGLVTAVPALIGFLVLERRSKAPLMPLWVFADRNRAGAYVIQTLLGAALFGMFFLMTLYLQNVLGYSPLKAGGAFLPATVVMMGMAGVMSKLVVRTGVMPLVAGGTALAAVGMLWLSQLTATSDYITGVMLPMTFLTAGLGSVFVPGTLAAVSGVDREHSGLVSGVSTTVIQIGGAIGIAVLANVATSSTNDAVGTMPLEQALTHGFSHAFIAAALLLAVAVPVALATLRLHPTADDVASGH
jgi:EmrB/QacA subfamily drug resistance transporter